MVRPATPAGLLGLILPTFAQGTSPQWADPSTPRHVADRAAGCNPSTGLEPMTDLRDTCRRAEELGAAALWACDHLFWHGPNVEAMTALTIAATATERATLGTCVMQLPLRHAPVVAKQAASLQNLTRGRFVLGVGVGSHEGEYEQAGVDFHSRGRLLDAGIRELRRSWATGRGHVCSDTEAGGASAYRLLPDPAPVPVWVGGSSESALRRAAELGDGWMPLFLSAAAYGQAVERLAKEVDRAGRPRDAVTPSMVLFVSIDDDGAMGRRRGTEWMSSLYGIPAKAFARHLVAGSPSEVAAVVAAFVEAGARHVPVYVTDDRPIGQFERLVDALAGAGLPAEERRG